MDYQYTKQTRASVDRAIRRLNSETRALRELNSNLKDRADAKYFFNNELLPHFLIKQAT